MTIDGTFTSYTQHNINYQLNMPNIHIVSECNILI